MISCTVLCVELYLIILFFISPIAFLSCLNFKYVAKLAKLEVQECIRYYVTLCYSRFFLSIHFIGAFSMSHFNKNSVISN